MVGFEGTEGGLILPEQGGGNNLGGGGGGGGGSPPGLIIQNESVASSTYTNVTITWLTSYPATSQVLYAQEGELHTLNLIDDSGAPPKYGYAHTTPESDNPANMHGVLSHSVTIFGLTPGTKYYYRAVSHGSFAVSEEHNFNTLSVNSASANSAIGETPSRGGNGGQVLSEENLGVAENIGNSGNIGTAATSFNGNVSGNTSATPKNLFATIIGALSFNWELIIALSIIAFILIIWGLFRKKEED